MQSILKTQHIYVSSSYLFKLLNPQMLRNITKDKMLVLTIALVITNTVFNISSSETTLSNHVPTDKL